MRPTDFPVGSFESRAAARALLDFRVAGESLLEVISRIPRPRQDNSRVQVGESQRINDRRLRWVVYVPVPKEECLRRRSD
jgi:hypothetical protein